MKTNTKKRTGFTLIELLVVISIIAVLMSIMIPALRRAREIAQNTICKSNMRGIGLAHVLWSEANDGWALPGQWDRGTQRVDGVVTGDPLLIPYMGDVKSGDGVGRCPSTPAKYAGKTYGELGLTNDVAGLATAGNYYSSYGYNIYLCNRTSKPLGLYDAGNDDGTQWGKGNIWWHKRGNTKLSTIRKAPEKVLFAEAILYVSQPNFYNKAMLNPAFKDPAARGRRHFARMRQVIGTTETELAGKMNIAWADGSVSEQPEGMEVVKSNGRGYEINKKYWEGE